MLSGEIALRNNHYYYYYNGYFQVPFYILERCEDGKKTSRLKALCMIQNNILTKQAVSIIQDNA